MKAIDGQRITLLLKESSDGTEIIAMCGGEVLNRVVFDAGTHAKACRQWMRRELEEMGVIQDE